MSEITIQHLSLAYEAGRSGQTEGAFSGVGLAGQGQSGFLTIIQCAAKPLDQNSELRRIHFYADLFCNGPALRHDRESYLPGLNIKTGIGRVALNKDPLLFGEIRDLPPAVDGRKESLGIEFAAFLGRCHGCHG
jgi:hypothetical protein